MNSLLNTGVSRESAVSIESALNFNHAGSAESGREWRFSKRDCVTATMVYIVSTHNVNTPCTVLVDPFFLIQAEAVLIRLSNHSGAQLWSNW